MVYVDVFVGPVPTADKEIYLAYARKMQAMTKQAGALSVMACWGDDSPGGMPNNPLATALDLKTGETLVTRFVKWESRIARETGWAALMKHPEMQTLSPPFDRSRVRYAGFDVIDEL
ncbi:MAG: DUF1428 domain-containing protein [Phyllobacteriaceae bacterium]|nr:DUF1428 domain-containing protein [Phyllobacteriaceae bacterium]